MMPSFLSEGNPLSAVSSVVNKFSLFDSKPESDEAARKQKAARGAEPAARGPVKSSSQQFVKREEREAAGRQQYSVPRIAPVPKKTLCPICNTAEIVGSPGTGQCNQCTQCQLLVCAQCGFNPNPHLSQVREWLCLNCQMQRALGIDMTSVPSSKPQPLQPKQQGVTSSAPQAAKQAPAQQPAPKPEQAKSLSHSGSRKQPVLTKQQSMVASPPLKAKQPSHGPRDPQPKQQASQKPQPAKPSQQLLGQKKQQDLNKPPQQLNSTAQGAERKQPSQSPQVQQKDAKPVSQDQQLAKKQEDSDISTQQQLQKKDNSVPGTELDTGVKDQKQDVSQQKQSVQVQKPVDKTQPPSISTAGPEVSKQPVPKGESKAAPSKEEQAKLAQKPPAAKVVPSQIPAIPKAQKPPEQSRRFSLNLGGSAQPPPFQPSTPPETVTGKLFGFGASLFSQASTLISAAPQQQDQHGHTAKQPPQTACKDSSVPQPSPKRDIGKKETKSSAAVDTFEQKAVGAAQTNTTDHAIIKKAAGVKESKPGAEMVKPTTKPLETGKTAPPKSTCPLCKTDLNIGSEAPPNFNTCTECKAVVCNLCGFNPMPHLTEAADRLRAEFLILYALTKSGRSDMREGEESCKGFL